MRRRWRCAASRWRSSAISSGRRRSCGGPRAPLAREKRSPAHGAWSPRPRSRSSRATWAGRRRRSTRREPRSTAHGDRLNAAHARHLEVRRLLLIGRVDEAERALAGLDPAPFPPASRAAHELVVAGIAMRRLRTKTARAALARAEARRAPGTASRRCWRRSKARSLVLNTPAARLIAQRRGAAAPARGSRGAASVERARRGRVPSCRASTQRAVVSLARRPVLFALARALGEAWPGDVPRDALVARAFGAKRADESHRARLRVEVGRLRTALRPMADVRATRRGFVLAPRRAREVVVLARPIDEEHAAVLAFLADGESWSSSALALALGDQPAHRAAGARRARGGRQGAVGRARAGAPLDDPAGAGIHDDLVTPRSPAD